MQILERKSSTFPRRQALVINKQKQKLDDVSKRQFQHRFGCERCHFIKRQNGRDLRRVQSRLQTWWTFEGNPNRLLHHERTNLSKIRWC